MEDSLSADCIAGQKQFVKTTKSASSLQSLAVSGKCWPIWGGCSHQMAASGLANCAASPIKSWLDFAILLAWQ